MAIFDCSAPSLNPLPNTAFFNLHCSFPIFRDIHFLFRKANFSAKHFLIGVDCEGNKHDFFG